MTGGDEMMMRYLFVLTALIVIVIFSACGWGWEEGTISHPEPTLVNKRPIAIGDSTFAFMGEGEVWLGVLLVAIMV